MSRIQRIVVLSALALLLLSALVPPWKRRLHYQGSEISIGTKYGPIWQPPVNELLVIELDVQRLLMEWLFLVLLTVGCVLLLRRDARIGSASR